MYIVSRGGGGVTHTNNCGQCVVNDQSGQHVVNMWSMVKVAQSVVNHALNYASIINSPVTTLVVSGEG